MLQDISDGASGASLVFLAVGLPQGSTGAGVVSLIAEGLLLADDVLSGNFSEAKQRGAVLILGIIGGTATKAGANSIAKGIQISVGKTGRYYEIGKQGAINSARALQRMVRKNIAEGYFGQEIAPAVVTEIITNVMEAYNALTEE